MNIRSFLRRVGFAALGLFVAFPALAVDVTRLPPGPRLITDVDINTLNSVIERVNGSTAGSYTGTFNGTVGATTPAAGAFTTLTASVSATIAAASGAVNGVSITPSATAVTPIITAAGAASDTNIGITLTGKGSGLVHLGGTTIANGSVRVPTVASAVNAVTLSGAITTAEPSITVGGSTSDTNIGLSISGKGTGAACLAGTTCANSSLAAVTTASAVVHANVTGGTTGNPVLIASAGETNSSVNVAGSGTGRATLGATTTCSGTTTATCSAQRFVVSITGLTTAAAGTTSAAMTVTNTLVTSSAVNVVCSVNGYSGTGLPIVSGITPGTGSVAMTVTNVAGSGSLNATVPIACIVI